MNQPAAALDYSYFPAATVTLAEPVDHQRQLGETASNWEKFTLAPGTYAVEYLDRSYRPADHGAAPYSDRAPAYARVQVPAVRTETYLVNRLFTASSVDHKAGLGQAAVVSFTAYAYQVQQAVAAGKGLVEHATVAAAS